MVSALLILILGEVLHQTDGVHVPGDVCHYWTRQFGCSPPPPISVWPVPEIHHLFSSLLEDAHGDGSQLLLTCALLMTAPRSGRNLPR